MIAVHASNGPRAHHPMPNVPTPERGPHARVNSREDWMERIEGEARAYCRYVVGASRESVQNHVKRMLRIHFLRHNEVERIDVVIAQTPKPNARLTIPAFKSGR